MYIWGSAPHLYQWPQLTPYNKTQKNKMTLVVCGCHSKVVVFFAVCGIFVLLLRCDLWYFLCVFLVAWLGFHFVYLFLVWFVILFCAYLFEVWFAFVCVCVSACFVLLFVVKCVFLLCFFLWHDMCSFVFALLFRDLHFVVWSAFFWCSFSW